MAECPRCDDILEPVTLMQGGRIGWWCERCKSLFPDGDYVTMRDQPIDSD